MKKEKIYMQKNEDDLLYFMNRRRGYHTRPINFFTAYTSKDNIKTEDDLLTIEKIGVELETEAKNSYADYDALCEKLSAAFNKKYDALFNYYNEDSSLDNYGLEIITMPFTQNFYKAAKGDFEELLNIATNSGLIGHDSGRCGIHVHINRACLGANSDEIDANIDKIVYFFEYYKAELKKFSRRKNWSYAQFASDKGCYTKIDKALYNIKTLKDLSRGHDAAINNRNDNTLEIRIFNSTLRASTFHAIIEFIFNLIKLVKNNPIEQCSFYNLINIDDAPYLKQYVKDRNINVTAKKVKRLDLEYIKKVNSSFDALQKTELHILKGLLPYYKAIARLNAQNAAADLKAINAINLKHIITTSKDVAIHDYTNILNNLQILYTHTNTTRGEFTAIFQNALTSIFSYFRDNKNYLNIDFEDFTNKIDVDEYNIKARNYKEVM